MRMFMACIVLIFVFMKTVTSEPDLQQQNQSGEYLNPVKDQEQEQPSKDQDKRTILSNHHGWAKHVGIHPSGFKYVIGYGPVDLKYVPVVRPINIRGHPHYHHHHHHPKLHLKQPFVIKPLLPVHPIIHHDGWKPVVPIVRPVVPIVKPVPVNVPAPPHIHHRPWQQEGWSGARPVHVQPAGPVSVQPIVQPIHHVPVKPVAPIVPSKPLYPVYPVAPFAPISVVPQVPTAGHVHLHNPAIVGQTLVEYHGTHHFVPINHVPVAVPPPVIVPQPAYPIHHFHPEPQIPVHPHPPLHFDHHHDHHPAHVHPYPQPAPPHDHLHPTHVHPYPQPAPPHEHLHPAHVHPYPPHDHLHPTHVHPYPQPAPPHEQHDVQTPLIPQNHPLFQQQLPEHAHHLFHQQQGGEGHPEIFQQQLPHEHPHPQEAHDPQLPQNPSILYHQQLPGNVQHLFNQQIQHSDSASSNILLQGSSIQPGQTDVQLPLHLPQHPNYLPEDGRQFQPGNFHDPSQHPENLVRPSVALEPPFSRK